ncbi:N-acetylmuramoyl-L-alanine amidase [Candidatus Nitrospira bockiana]
MPVLVAAFLAFLLPVEPILDAKVVPSLTAVDAAPSDHRPMLTAARKRSRKSANGPALIQDIRVTPYPDHTRLVFDLQRQVSFTQRREKQPERLVIHLPNTSLGKVAKARVNQGDLPDEVMVVQSNHGGPQSVSISLELESLTDYKLLPLTNPHRLVVDLYSKPPIDETAMVDRPPTIKTAPPPTRRPVGRDVKTIVIDAGHGGKDPGAVGRGGTAEKDITLKVSLLLRDFIQQRLGKRVLLTRDRDVFVELEDRAKFANRHEADLFVSVHVNSHPQRSTKGLEIYHFGEASDPRALAVAARENGTPIENTGVGWQYLVADLLTTKKMEESLELAWSTKQALVSHLNTHYDVVDHGVKTGPFYVLRFTAMPSILAEIGFISNPGEERLMQGQAFLNRIAEGIFEGIKAFITPPQVAVGGGKGYGIVGYGVEG